jgi:molybdenum cofactor guanylyltransferase
LRIFGVILAGGQGRRMGGADKAFLPLRGKPLISHVLDRLHPQVDRVLISANGDSARLAHFRCDVVADHAPQGPLSGILAAMERAAELGATHLASTPVDTPFLPVDLVARLVSTARSSGRDLVLAHAFDGAHPLCALWPVTLIAALSDYLAEGKAKVTGFTDTKDLARCLFATREAFMNLNTPEDLARAEALMQARA